METQWREEASGRGNWRLTNLQRYELAGLVDGNVADMDLGESNCELFTVPRPQ